MAKKTINKNVEVKVEAPTKGSTKGIIKLVRVMNSKGEIEIISVKDIIKLKARHCSGREFTQEEIKNFNK